jgi:hypothetical protein
MTTGLELDALLAKPLASVADDGFSHAVATKIAAQERAVFWFEWGSAAVLFVLVLLFVPWNRLIAPFENVAFDLGLSVPFAIACAALALTHVGARMFEA